MTLIGLGALPERSRLNILLVGGARRFPLLSDVLGEYEVDAKGLWRDVDGPGAGATEICESSLRITDKGKITDRTCERGRSPIGRSGDFDGRAPMGARVSEIRRLEPNSIRPKKKMSILPVQNINHITIRACG